MSLVLNGGVGGSDSTQYAYIDSKIVSALPATVSFWFKNGTNSNAGGQFAQWVDKDATLGTYRMGGGSSRSVGPVFTRFVGSRISTATFSAASTSTSFAANVTSIATGATTVVGLEDAAAFDVGQYVRLDGTFDGISGITSGREWRIASIASSTLTLELSSSGTWSELGAATVKWSAWQPEKWNFGLLSFAANSGETNNLVRGGFLGNTAMTLAAAFSGTSGQKPQDIFDVLDRLCLGGYLQSDSATGHFRGELAHVAVWDVRPTDGQADELLIKAPTLVSWGSPVAYWPLLADEADSIGSNDLTLVGSPTINDEGPSIQLTSGGGGTPGFLRGIMSARNPSIFGVR